ncbi:Thioesterase/thiol ester dehydrase-isomerase [Aulographum hederae CBS 113979]|uniref:Thioesterase/thiol ester dehydrase-isomerase n=1 Tax=Aulographum hederae CBS 113979 TaxID=1176131 RepID=A0A6G1H8U4_9PEZI|nr:Thioesterase/thiol ester dehydrase-isomerase [Aulographum hederae CBS 113979]
MAVLRPVSRWPKSALWGESSNFIRHYHSSLPLSRPIFSLWQSQLTSARRLLVTGPVLIRHRYQGPSLIRLQSTAPDGHTTYFPAEPAQIQQEKPHRFSFFTLAFFLAVLGFGCFTISFTMAFRPAMKVLQDWTSPPTDEETLLLYEPDPDSFAASANQYIQSHPLVQHLRKQEHLIESRPHMKIPPKLRPNNLTGGTLIGDTKIATPPLTFVTADGSEYVSITYLGPDLCGHPGIVHGGLLATLLDEGLARCCFPALPNKVGVTANLNLNYRKPCMAGQYVVLRAQTTKVEGRKAWVKGWIETMPAPELMGEDGKVVDEGKGPVVLVEADALFIEPKNAAMMPRIDSTQSNSAVDLQKKRRQSEAEAVAKKMEQVEEQQVQA